MAKFGGGNVSDIDIKSTLYTQQGVVDKSDAMMWDAAAAQVRPVATTIAGNMLRSDLEDIDEGNFEEQQKLEAEKKAEVEALNSDPNVTKFQAELNKLHTMSSKMDPTQYDARRRAALKKYVSVVPGLTSELNQVYNQYMFLNKHELPESQASGSGSGGYGSYDQQLQAIEKQGVTELKLSPGWTQDPAQVAYYEKHMATKQALVVQGDTLKMLQNTNATNDEMQKLGVQSAQTFVGQQFLDFTNPSNPKTYQIPVGEGQEPLSINPHDAVAVGQLTPEQKDYLEDMLMSEKAQYRNQLTANMTALGADPALLAGSYNMIDNYYDSAIGMLDDTPSYTRGQQQQQRLANEQTRAQWTIDEIKRSTEYQKALVDRQFVNNHYFEALKQQSILVGQLSIMGTPAGNQAAAIASMGMDLNTPAFKELNLRLQNDVINNPKMAFQLPEKWAEYLKSNADFYGGISANTITEPAADAAAMQLDGFAKSVIQHMDTMSLPEQRDVMNIISQGGVEALATRYPETYEKIGKNIEVALPNMGQKLMDKMTNDLAENELYLAQGIYIARNDDGTFRVETYGEADEKAVATFKRKYVDTMNAYAKALANTSSSLDLKGATDVLIEKALPKQRVQQLYSKYFDQVSTKYFGSGSPAESRTLKGETGLFSTHGKNVFNDAEQMTREMMDGLFGEGTYNETEKQDLQSKGYKQTGETEKYWVFTREDGSSAVVEKD